MMGGRQTGRCAGLLFIIACDAGSSAITRLPSHGGVIGFSLPTILLIDRRPPTLARFLPLFFFMTTKTLQGSTQIYNIWPPAISARLGESRAGIIGGHKAVRSCLDPTCNPQAACWVLIDDDAAKPTRPHLHPLTAPLHSQLLKIHVHNNQSDGKSKVSVFEASRALL